MIKKIITDAKQIAKIEKEKNEKVGIVYQDEHFCFQKDAVEFSDGTKGTFMRMLDMDDSCKKNHIIVPVCNGKIVLLCRWKHATQSFSIELPRGEKRNIESLDKILIEQTGYESIYDEQEIDFFYINTDLMEHKMYISYVEVEKAKEPLSLDMSENIILLDIDTLKQYILSSAMEIRDSFTQVALFQCILRGLI